MKQFETGEIEQLSSSRLVDRTDYARTLIERILSSGRKVLVLYGREAVGKTHLVKRWMAQVLESDEFGYHAFYASCEPDFPQAVERAGESVDPWVAGAGKSVVFVDEFDRVLVGDRRARDHALARLARWAEEVEGDARFVVIVREESLGKLLGVGRLLPELLAPNAVIEVVGVGVENGLRSLRTAESGETGVHEALIDALAEDEDWADVRERQVSPDLVTVLAFMARRLAEETGRHETSQAEVAAEIQDLGLLGVLEQYLDYRIEDLGRTFERSEEPSVMEIAHSLLGDVVFYASDERDLDLDRFARRMGAPEDDCRRIWQWLEQEGELIRRLSDRIGLVPTELEEVVEQYEDQREQAAAMARRHLQRGVDSWQDQGVLLPRSRFLEIHANRWYIYPDETELALMVLSSLLYGDDEAADYAGYWLRRVEEPDDRLRMLLDAVLNPRPVVRSRAAARLVCADTQLVRSQLLNIALEDPEREVRAQAVDTLARLSSEDLTQRVHLEVRKELSTDREAAVYALRIFDDEESIGLLRELIDDHRSFPTVRSTAIESLAAIETEGAVTALLEVALYDRDLQDREGALNALCRLKEGSLLQHLKRELRVFRPVEQQSEGQRGVVRALGGAVGRLLLSSLLGAASLLLHGLMLILIGRVAIGTLLLVLEAGAVTLIALEVGIGFGFWILAGTLILGNVLPLRQLLRERRDDLEPSRMDEIALLPLIFVNTMTSFLVIHGLAHAIRAPHSRPGAQGPTSARNRARWRNARHLFGAEILGLALLFGTEFLSPFFEISIVPFSEELALVLTSVYIGVGFLLFLGSWIVDVWGLFEEVGEERKTGIYRRLLADSRFAAIYYEDLSDEHRSVRRQARSTLRRYRRDINPAVSLDYLSSPHPASAHAAVLGLRRHRERWDLRQLKQLWSGADKPLRARICSVLAGRLHDGSIALLRELEGVDWIGKLKCAFARVRRALPAARLVPILLALPVLSILVYETYRGLENPFRWQVKTLRSSQKPEDLRVRFARALAAGDSQQFLSEADRIFWREESSRSRDLQKALVRGYSLLAMEAREPSVRKKALTDLVARLGSRHREVQSATIEHIQRVAATTPSEQLIREVDEALRTVTDSELLSSLADALGVIALEAGHQSEFLGSGRKGAGRDLRVQAFEALARHAIDDREPNRQKAALEALLSIKMRAPRFFSMCLESPVGVELKKALESMEGVELAEALTRKRKQPDR